ncbi:HNH endonuclease [Haloarcula amylolytica]|uniref:HNH endonuclease n=1 Tax=Haloarcula amylolytica TaxID=396317 RepID=UPI003C74D5AD
MTPDPEGKPIDASAADVHEWMQRKDYNAAPLYDKQGKSVGYVRKDRIEDIDRPIRRYRNSFELDVILSTGASFDAVLDALCQNYFYFLGGADELAGIVTRADLNKTPVYIHFYERLTRFEEKLRDYLTNSLDDWTQFLDGGPVGQMEARRERQSGLTLDLINYANFSDLITVVYESEVWKDLEYESSSEAESKLGSVIDLRNDVAHRKLILYRDEIDKESEARDVLDLHTTYQELLQRTQKLNWASGSVQEDKKKSETRIFRQDSDAVTELQNMYAETCQVCGDTSTTELCHILPIQEGGTTTIENMLVLCPNHHMEFDRGELHIDPDTLEITAAHEDALVGTKLTVLGNHRPSAEKLQQRYREEI